MADIRTEKGTPATRLVWVRSGRPGRAQARSQPGQTWDAALHSARDKLPAQPHSTSCDTSGYPPVGESGPRPLETSGRSNPLERNTESPRDGTARAFRKFHRSGEGIPDTSRE